MSYDEKKRNKYIVQIKTFLHVRIEALESSIRTCVISEERADMFSNYDIDYSKIYIFEIKISALSPITRKRALVHY